MTNYLNLILYETINENSKRFFLNYGMEGNVYIKSCYIKKQKQKKKLYFIFSIVSAEKLKKNIF